MRTWVIKSRILIYPHPENPIILKILIQTIITKAIPIENSMEIENANYNRGFYPEFGTLGVVQPN